MATTTSTSTKKKWQATAKSSSSGSTAKKSTSMKKSSAAKSTTAKTTARSNGKAAKTAAAPAAKAKASKPAAAKTTSKKTASNGKGPISSIVEKVTGLFKPSGDDAISLLKTDHDRVDKLFKKVKANEDGNNAATFKKIKAELDVHAHIEEKIFYPHLLKEGDKELKKIVLEGIEEHGQAKMFLAEMAEMKGTDPKFKAKMAVLIEDIEHHVKEEENEMFPLVEDQIGEDMLKKLGALMEAEKAKFMPAPKSKAAAK